MRGRSADGSRLVVAVGCTDAQSGVAAVSLSLGTEAGSGDLLAELPLPLRRNASAVNASSSAASNATALSANRTSAHGRVLLPVASLSAPLREGQLLFATLTCLSGAGILASSTAQFADSWLVDTQPPASGALGFPKLAWSDGVGAWVASPGRQTAQ